MKEQYFRISWLEEDEAGTAYAPEDANHNFLPDNGYYYGAINFEMALKDGSYCDYLSNNLGLSLCSEKLKNILCNYLSDNKCIQWIEVTVRSSDFFEKRRYYFLHFPEKFDVLDTSKSIFAKGSNFVVKAIISATKALGLKVFEYKGKYNGVIVSNEVKNAIEKELCSGIVFLKLPIL